MSSYDLLRSLLARGAYLRVENGRLLCTAPEGGLSAQEVELLKAKRDELIALLAAQGNPAASPDALPEEPGDKQPSTGQERLWTLCMLENVAGAYNQGLALRMTGSLNIEALAYALSRVIERHEPLRSRYPADEGSISVRIDPPRPVELPVVDCCGSSDPLAQACAQAAEALEAPYDLERGPLLRSSLYQLGHEDHLFIIGVHHLVADAWSWGVLMRELTAFYRERALDEPFAPQPLRLNYFEAAGRARRAMERDSRVLQADLEYWKAELQGAPVLDLPTSWPRPARQSHEGDVVTFEIDADLRSALEQVCRRAGATLFMGMLGLYQALLARYSGQDDIVVGIPESGRMHPETEALIGYFINTLVVRIGLTDEMTLPELLGAVRSKVLGAMEHRMLPFDRLVRELNVERDFSRSPVFQAMFSFPGMDPLETCFPGLQVTEVMLPRRSTMFDVTLWVTERGGALLCELEYRSDLFQREFMAGFAERYVTFMRQVISHPEAALMRLPLMGVQPQQAVVRGRAGRSETDWATGSFLGWVREQVAQDGARAAVLDEHGNEWSYADLWAWSARVAAGLSVRGIGRGSLVGVRLARGAPMLGVVLGILRAGAAYLPLDPDFPDGRLRYMVEDSGAELVVSDEPDVELGQATMVSPEQLLTSGQVPAAELDVARTEDLAYVIYTSGSTGLPKGVEITHGALRNFLGSMSREPGISSEDVLVAVTTLSFDISTLELFLPLCVGARVVIPDHETVTDGYELQACLATHAATIMQATPATWRLLLDADWTGRLRKAFCGGEPLSEELAREMLARVDELWNLYGPTETTVWSSLQRIEAGEPVTIGRPVANTRIYVLDRNGQLVPDGVPGELWIAGAGLARGYRKRPELTQERFREDPYVAGERMYRTGDLGRWRLDGRLEHLGRLDHQVKVHGYRIELGEIEAALEALPEVRQAVVMARGSGEDRRLVGYVLFESGRQLLAGEIRRRLGETLPQYMIPGIVVAMDAFPLTANGKVDRKALPDPVEKTVPSRRHEPPTGELEQHLADVWRDLLGVAQVGRHDNFFELGGHSLLVLRAVAEIKRRTGRDIDPRAFFYRTLSQIAAAEG